MFILRASVDINDASKLITDFFELAIHQASLDTEATPVVDV
jgi:hypothetical protein